MTSTPDAEPSGRQIQIEKGRAHERLGRSHFMSVSISVPDPFPAIRRSTEAGFGEPCGEPCLDRVGVVHPSTGHPTTRAAGVSQESGPRAMGLKSLPGHLARME